MLRTYLRKIKDWMFPLHCIICTNYSGRDLALCQHCEARLPHFQPGCEICGSDINKQAAVQLCIACLKKPPAFDALSSLYCYEEPVNYLITDIKFHQKLAYARLFSQLMLNKIITEWYSKTAIPQLIIPVPLHPHRLRQRGFNQALEIARPIARTLNIPLSIQSCQRVKPTEPQSALPAEKRLSNLKNAFVLTKTIPYQHVAILDDVVTTGHTVNEMAKVLKQQGINRVDVWCCGRTQKHL